jgi:hypothetical protein
LLIDDDVHFLLLLDGFDRSLQEFDLLDDLLLKTFATTGSMELLFLLLDTFGDKFFSVKGPINLLHEDLSLTNEISLTGGSLLLLSVNALFLFLKDLHPLELGCELLGWNHTSISHIQMRLLLIENLFK